MFRKNRLNIKLLMFLNDSTPTVGIQLLAVLNVHYHGHWLNSRGIRFGLWIFDDCAGSPGDYPDLIGFLFPNTPTGSPTVITPGGRPSLTALPRPPATLQQRQAPVRPLRCKRGGVWSFSKIKTYPFHWHLQGVKKTPFFKNAALEHQKITLSQWKCLGKKTFFL